MKSNTSAYGKRQSDKNNVTVDEEVGHVSSIQRTAPPRKIETFKCELNDYKELEQC